MPQDFLPNCDVRRRWEWKRGEVTGVFVEPTGPSDVQVLIDYDAAMRVMAKAIKDGCEKAAAELRAKLDPPPDPDIVIEKP